MGVLLFLVGVVVAAYVLAHVVLERAQQRFLFVSGIEYVGLGVLLGPAVFPTALQPFGDLEPMGPVFAFAAGWVGLLSGLELDVRVLTSLRSARIGLTDAAVTGAVVAAVCVGVLRTGVLGSLPSEEETWIAGLVLGSAAAAGSTSAIDLLATRYRGLSTELLPTLNRSIRLGHLVAISVFGLVFCLFHHGATSGVVASYGDWMAWTLGLGVILAAILFLFLGRAPSDNHVFLGMVGTLFVASGAAFFLQISALLVNLVLGFVLARTSLGGRLSTELERTRGPVGLVLLVFAGALWRPVPLLPGLGAIGVYVLARTVGKAVASGAATVGTPLRSDLYRGLMAQGHVAVAMAVSFRLVYDGPLVDYVYTAIVAGTVVADLFSPRLLRGLLVDAGEIRQDLGHRAGETVEGA